MKRWRWLLVALVLAAAGCEIDEGDLDTWRHVARGEERLAGFLLDAERPIERRSRAIAVLLEMDALGQIMGVLHDTTPEDRKILVPHVAAHVTTQVRSGATVADQARAASLGFYLMQYLDELDAPRADRLVTTLVDWALEQHAAEVRLEHKVSIDDLLLAAVTVRPELVRTPLVDHLRSQSDTQRLVTLYDTLSRARDEQLQRRLAAVLLDYARRRHPALELPLADRMVASGDETLLRFLLDAARDSRVPHAVRDTALRAAKSLLGSKGLDGYFRLIRTDDPATNNIYRLNGLDLAWDFGGVRHLADALRALPADASWPDQGDELRAEVDRFCDNRVARQKAAARAVLLDLVTDRSWVARAYAMECIIRLYPGDAALLLEPLARDKTRLPGWSTEGEVTIADVVRQLKEG